MRSKKCVNAKSKRIENQHNVLVTDSRPSKWKFQSFLFIFIDSLVAFRILKVIKGLLIASWCHLSLLEVIWDCLEAEISRNFQKFLYFFHYDNFITTQCRLKWCWFSELMKSFRGRMTPPPHHVTQLTRNTPKWLRPPPPPRNQRINLHNN